MKSRTLQILGCLREISGTNEPESACSSAITDNTQPSVIPMETTISETQRNTNEQVPEAVTPTERSSNSPSRITMTPQLLRNTSLSISTPFSQTTGNLEGDQTAMARQISLMQNPQPDFDATSPTAPLIRENVASSASTDSDELRLDGGNSGMITFAPIFQVHPDLQSRLQALRNDMNRPEYITQPPGILRVFRPPDTETTNIDEQETETISRVSQLLHPHIRRRARRRSRASRVLQNHMRHHLIQHQPREGPNADNRETTLPTSTTFGLTTTEGQREEGGETSITSAAPTTVKLNEPKLKQQEESYNLGENFECNICFQKANEAVVTCCGHLFCWPCLYRWLYIHSSHHECPVCKGAIDENTITPIYGRECENSISARQDISNGPRLARIPPRPQARRVESARQLQEREQRIREREQRERALERERERQQQERGDLSNARVLGSFMTVQTGEVTSTSQITEGLNQVEGPNARDDLLSQETNSTSYLEEIDSSEQHVNENGGFGEAAGTSSQTPATTSNLLFDIQQQIKHGSETAMNRIRSLHFQRSINARQEQLRLSHLPQGWKNITDTGGILTPINATRVTTPMRSIQGETDRTLGKRILANINREFLDDSLREDGGAVMQMLHQPWKRNFIASQVTLPAAKDVGIASNSERNDSSLDRQVTVDPTQRKGWIEALPLRIPNTGNVGETSNLQRFQESPDEIRHLSGLPPPEISSLHSQPSVLEPVTGNRTRKYNMPLILSYRWMDEICPNFLFPKSCSVSTESKRKRREEEQITAKKAHHEVDVSASSSGVTFPQSSNSRAPDLTCEEPPLSGPGSKMDDEGHAILITTSYELKLDYFHLPARFACQVLAWSPKLFRDFPSDVKGGHRSRTNGRSTFGTFTSDPKNCLLKLQMPRNRTVAEASARNFISFKVGEFPQLVAVTIAIHDSKHLLHHFSIDFWPCTSTQSHGSIFVRILSQIIARTSGFRAGSLELISRVYAYRSHSIDRNQRRIAAGGQIIVRVGADLNWEKEEARWVREEQRWLREEQRWLREEARWLEEKQALIEDSTALRTQVSVLKRELEEIRSQLRTNEVTDTSLRNLVSGMKTLLQALTGPVSGDSLAEKREIQQISPALLVSEVKRAIEVNPQVIVAPSKVIAVLTPDEVSSTSKSAPKDETSPGGNPQTSSSVPESIEGAKKASSPVPRKSRTLKTGTDGDDVKELHEALAKQGFYSGEEEMEFSMFSDGTESAVKTWQASIGVREDGQVTPQLLAKLLGRAEDKTEKEKESGAAAKANNSATSNGKSPDVASPKAQDAATRSSREIDRYERTDAQDSSASVSKRRVYLLGENRWEEPDRLSRKREEESKPGKVNGMKIAVQKCFSCNGVGTMLCTDCEGTGDLNVEEQFLEWIGEEPVCPYCDGVGAVPCDICDGQGVQSVKK
ncbi:hypothetical protein R1sor_017058 [Riccia sorocarpa]|uniref:RING-type E3 ubiquitin transferase n=1 Tax=Riccia sorocarpa TaxID=122646 RepID=A0ABD3I685_9MARC